MQPLRCERPLPLRLFLKCPFLFLSAVSCNYRCAAVESQTGIHRTTLELSEKPSGSLVCKAPMQPLSVLRLVAS